MVTHRYGEPNITKPEKERLLRTLARTEANLCANVVALRGCVHGQRSDLARTINALATQADLLSLTVTGMVVSINEGSLT